MTAYEMLIIDWSSDLCSSDLYLSRVPQPGAWIRSAISLFARILSAVALATFRILPRIGRAACVLRSRACLAEPPALSPSPMKSSVPAGSSDEQSVRVPGRRRLSTEQRRVGEELVSSFRSRGPPYQ